jgi:DNA-binding transcriptional ArsR family regulator
VSVERVGLDDFNEIPTRLPPAEPTDSQWNGEPAVDVADEPDSRPILFVTLREFLELDFPPAESLVGHVRGGTNLLPRYGWVMPWGREGSTKTTLLVDMLFHAAAGRQWLHYPIARPLRIVAIINEGVPGGFQDKLAEKHELWNGDEAPLDGLALYASPWGEFTFRNERMLRHLSDFARDFEADYVAGDPLHTLGSSGSGTPEETEEFKHLLRRFGVWEWIGILTAHHSNKAGMVSGDWARHPDTVIHLEKDGCLPRTKLTVQKARPADPAELGAPLLLEWLVEMKGYRLVEGDPEKIADANRERVLAAVHEGLRSAVDVAERTGLSARTAKRHFRDLARAELIRLEEGPNRTLLAFPRGEDDDPEPELQEELEWS